MGDSITVKLSTDSEGFLSQECPSCERRFKVKLGEGSDQPIAYYPYCGHAGKSCWWTPEQAAYLSAKVKADVIGTRLDAMARDFNRRALGSRGLLSISMKVNHSQVPSQPDEQDDHWPKASFECCNEVIKHEVHGEVLCCVICGLGGTAVDVFKHSV